MIVTPERTVYALNQDLHRTNGPASIWNDGRWYWYSFGNYHRYYGPSMKILDWHLGNRFLWMIDDENNQTRRKHKSR